MLTYLPGRRYTLWGVIASALLAGLSGWAVATYNSATPVIILAMSLAGLLLLGIQRRRWHYSLVVLFFVSLTLYRGIWLKYRLWVAGFPINILDFLVVFTGLCAYLSLVGGGQNRGMPWHKASMAIPMLLFGGVNIIGGLQGLSAGYPMYTLLRHIVVSIYLAIIYFSTLALVHDDAQIELLVRILLIGALFVSIEQIFHIVFPNALLSPALNPSSAIRYQFDASRLANMDVAAAIQLYRTPWIPYVIIPPAMTVLLSSMVESPDFINKRRSYLLFLLYATATILTFTRAVWIVSAVSLLTLVVIVGSREGRRGRLVGRLLPLLLLSLLGFLVLNILLPTPVDFAVGAGERLRDTTLILNSLASSDIREEIHFTGRFNVVKFSVEAVLEGNIFDLFLGRGYGFTFDSGELTVADRHNTYAFYLSRTGLVGLGTLLLILWLGLKRGVEIHRRASSAFYRMTAIGLVAGYGGLAVLGLSSGVFYSVHLFSFWGISFALLDIMAYRCDQDRIE